MASKIKKILLVDDDDTTRVRVHGELYVAAAGGHAGKFLGFGIRVIHVRATGFG